MGHIKNKIYYTVEKQLDDIDGVGTTNGLADIHLYKIQDNEIVYLDDITIDTTFNYEDQIFDHMGEFFHEFETSKIELGKL